MPMLALLLIACSLGITAAVLAIAEHRRAGHAAALLARANEREAEANAARHVLNVEILNPHRFTDADKELVRCLGSNGEPISLAFTNADFLRARVRGNHLEAELRVGTARLVR